MSYKSLGQKFFREGKDNRLDARAHAQRQKKTEVWAVKTFGGSSMQKSNFPTTFPLASLSHCILSCMANRRTMNGLIQYSAKM